MKYRILKPIIFLIIISGIFIQFDKVFSYKFSDGIFQWTAFYKQQQNTIDLLSIGSSHIIANVNTGILWDDYGIASFNLCGSIQPLWNSYFYLKEGLKYQRPKIVCLDAYRAIEDREFIDDSRIIKNNYGLKFSIDKVRSLIVSSPRKSLINYILEFPTYHNRYSEIGENDFLGIASEGMSKGHEFDWKGFHFTNNFKKFDKPYIKVSPESKGMNLTSKSEKYLRMIIELCKTEKIDLVIIIAPYAGDSVHDELYYKRVAEIAQEYNVPFINFNEQVDLIGINFSEDCADQDYLNYHGSAKFTRYFGHYLKSHYNIPDRRGNNAYKTYDHMAADLRNLMILTDQNRMKSKNNL